MTTRPTPLEDPQVTIDRLLAGLRAELTPDQYARVQQVHREAADHGIACVTATMDTLVEGIAAHFGPWAPLVRAIAAHVYTDGDQIGECRDHCTHPWPYTGRNAPEPTSADSSA